MSDDPNDETIGKDNLTDRERNVLPQWASERIAELREENTSAQAVIDASGEGKETAISYGGKSRRFIPDGMTDRIRIGLSDDGEDFVNVARKKHSKDGRFYLEIDGSGTIAVLPLSSGTARVLNVQEGEL